MQWLATDTRTRLRRAAYGLGWIALAWPPLTWAQAGGAAAAAPAGAVPSAVPSASAAAPAVPASSTVSSAAAHAHDEAVNLFFIKRSKNRNEVHYDAQVTDCTWGRPEVLSYWRTLEQGPGVYEDISLFEVPAYGFNVTRQTDQDIEIRLKALPDRPITARLWRTEGTTCRLTVSTEIAGASRALRAVYVYAEEGFLGIPTVYYIDVLGHDAANRVSERVRKARGERRPAREPAPSLWQSGAPDFGRPR